MVVTTCPLTVSTIVSNAVPRTVAVMLGVLISNLELGETSVTVLMPSLLVTLSSY